MAIEAAKVTGSGIRIAALQSWGLRVHRKFTFINEPGDLEPLWAVACYRNPGTRILH